jgi:hypothetical protein
LKYLLNYDLTPKNKMALIISYQQDFNEK